MQKLPPLQDFGGSQRIGNADDVATRQVQGQAGRGQQFVDVLVDLARGQRFIHEACFVSPASTRMARAVLRN